MIEFTIDETPVPKGRPRARVMFAHGLVDRIVALVRGGSAAGIFAAVRSSAKVQVYTPEETKNAAEMFAWKAKKFAPRKPLLGPLRVDILFTVKPPASFPKARSRTWPTVKPDKDNYEKLVLDALNGIFWHDDAQICSGTVTKIYGGAPSTRVRIESLNDDAREQRAWEW